MYLFLDIDGVLNRQCQWKKPYSLYEPCFPVLKKIVEQTKGKLILISTWKTGLVIRENMIQKVMVSDDNTEQINRLIKMLMEYDMYLYGKTSNLPGRTREREIERFLYFNPGQYIILDDDLSIYNKLERVVKIDCTKGLREADIKKNNNTFYNF